MVYHKIIFVAQTGTCREAMAAGIFGEFVLQQPLEITSRGLVVQFPEPMNQKAEAVLISNGINMEGFVSQQLTEEDLAKDALVITMEQQQKGVRLRDGDGGEAGLPDGRPGDGAYSGTV